MYEPFRMAMESTVREIATKVIMIEPEGRLQLLDQSMLISMCNTMDELSRFLDEINRVFDIELEEDQAMLLMTIEGFLDMLWLEVDRTLWYPGRSPRPEEDDEKSEEDEDHSDDGADEDEEEPGTEGQSRGLTIHVPPSLAAQLRTVGDVLAIGRLVCPSLGSSGSATDPRENSPP
jgi:hypothetical protein